MSYFANCTATVTRSQGNRTPAGYEQTGSKEILSCRGDAQEGGRSLERLQQLHDVGDVVFFAEQSVTDVEAGDNVILEMDDGRTIGGSVEEVVPLDDSLLVGLD
jgi:hypothetical protein